MELAECGVTVNAVAPGSLVTPMFAKFLQPSESWEEAMQRYLPQIPLHRLGSAQEIAETIASIYRNWSAFPMPSSRCWSPSAVVAIPRPSVRPQSRFRVRIDHGHLKCRPDLAPDQAVLSPNLSRQDAGSEIRPPAGGRRFRRSHLRIPEVDILRITRRPWCRSVVQRADQPVGRRGRNSLCVRSLSRGA